MDLTSFVTSIVRDLRIPGGHGSARHTFTAFVVNHRDQVSDLIMALAEATEPAPGVITVGTGMLLYGNPLRDGYAWRCGECLHIFRHGGPDPKAGVNYKTQRGAASAARKHSSDDHAGTVPVKEITR